MMMSDVLCVEQAFRPLHTYTPPYIALYSISISRPNIKIKIITLYY